MKNFELWPAIDLIDGKPVRLYKGDYDQKTEYETSLSTLAKQFSRVAFGIHVVDLEGAKKQKPVNFKAFQEIFSSSKIPFEVGGGIRNTQDIENLLAAGAKRVILGTSALKNPKFLQDAVNTFSPEKIVVGVDAKDGMVATHGWEEKSNVDAEEFIEKLQKKFGIQTIIFTDIATDGTLSGPPLKTFARLVKKFPTLHIIASGGIANMNDIQKLKEIGVQGAIFGKAFYENKISLEELENFYSTL
jgi:phosphoribosylformimino-5-aminoimidazole carboxamide ribotide isomerase